MKFQIITHASTKKIKGNRFYRDIKQTDTGFPSHIFVPHSKCNFPMALMSAGRSVGLS